VNTVDAARTPLVVVDVANTVGSVPDGWWRDRRGAAERLRDALAPMAERGLSTARADVPEWAARGPLDIALVVEGAARGTEPVPGVRTLDAPHSGDDLIVELVTQAAHDTPGRHVLVITADRGLRERVRAHGASVAGPRTVHPARP
jgi:hypothetical protein